MLNLIDAESEIEGYKPEISKRAAPYNDPTLTAIPKRRSCSDLTVRLFPAIHIKKKTNKIAGTLATYRLYLGANAITQSMKIISFIAFAVKLTTAIFSRFGACSSY